MTLGVFKEIEHLIEYIPVNSQENDGHDARLEKGTSMDSKFAFIDVGGVSTRLGIIEPDPSGITFVSLRDIIRLLNKFLKDARIEELTPTHNNYDGRLETESKIKAQIRSILFDYCLAALEGNNFDARLYLVHLLHFAGLRKRLNLLLAILVVGCKN